MYIPGKTSGAGCAKMRDNPVHNGRVQDDLIPNTDGQTVIALCQCNCPRLKDIYTFFKLTS